MLESAEMGSLSEGGGYSFQPLQKKPLIGLIFHYEPFMVWVALWGEDGRGKPVCAGTQSQATGQITSLHCAPIGHLFRYAESLADDERFSGGSLRIHPPNLRCHLRERVSEKTAVILNCDWPLSDAAAVARMVSAVGRRAWQLFQSNPTLALMLATPREFEDLWTLPAPEWHELFQLRQFECLQMLGFPAKKSLPQLLRRMAWAASEMIEFRRVLRSDPGWLKVLDPLPPLSPEVVQLMFCWKRRWFETSFLRHLLIRISDSRPSACRSLYFKMMHGGFDWRDFQPAQTIRSLEDLRHELSILEEPSLDAVFPPAPVNGDEQTVPITSPESLYGLALAMQNCAWRTYSGLVRAGLVYFFQHGSMSAGVTIRLAKRDGSWRLMEVSGQRNREPSGLEWRSVWQWAVSQGLASSSL